MPERPPAARAAASRRASDSGPSAKRNKRDHVELKVEQSTPERGARRASTSASPASPGAPPFSPPGDWPEVLRLIKQMRAAGGAPVDTMGCEKISEDAAPDAKGRRFVTLVSAMLSSQTKDPITHAATARLVAFGCTPEKIAGSSVEQLDALITPVGFHQRKAGYLKAAAAICVERYDSDIPPSVETLTELPGVGPKMAYLVMNVGWGKASGICVDVHVHRIAERMGWVPPVAYSAAGTPRKTRTPEDTRVCLESWLPEEEWVEINPLLVGHGQLTCTPRAPKCGECLVNALCPSAFAAAKPEKEDRDRERGDERAGRDETET